tara:strand:- start:395 stop:517 length:123 start_codon:yes stop_codon:yes gene_type:complete
VALVDLEVDLLIAQMEHRVDLVVAVVEDVEIQVDVVMYLQ